MPRMQQRRKTSTNWTSTNEVLLDGELGIESDTGKLKLGDGSTGWNALAYSGGTTPNSTVAGYVTAAGETKAALDAAYDVKGAAAALVAAAPAALDTLNELAAALGNDPNFATTVTTSLGTKLTKTANLSDVSNAATARSNLGLAPVAASGAYTDLTGQPTALPPSGTAGGDLTGTFPNPTLAAIVTAGTVGSASAIPVITYDAKGRITATSTASISGGSGPLTNFTATTDPTTASDSSAGYAAGSRWINTATAVAYECLSATAGAAVWRRLTADVQVFTASGTWTKPAWSTVVQVEAIGAGGGGGSGARYTSGTATSGGAGGGSGGRTNATFPASVLGATETVTVGTGGGGGAAVTANTTFGTAGIGGGNTTFGTTVRVRAGGAGGGGGGSTSPSAAGTSGGGTLTGVSGGAGASGAAGAASSNSNGSPTSGGAGGGVTTTPAFTAGGNAGYVNAIGTTATSGGLTAGSAGAVSTLPGLTGTALPGYGGGGGASSATAAAGNGGNATSYGGGGGGGGSSINGFNSGAGGNGANGVVVVISQ